MSETLLERPPIARPSIGRAWWSAVRPATLAASFAPVVAGTALAAGEGGVRWGAAVAALLGAALLQVGTNLHNDAADHARGADGPGRLGPPRATALGWLSATAVRRAALVAFALSLAPGAYLVALGGWPILAIGVLGIACGLLYTGGPWPLAYVGLGEAFVLAFFGVAAVAGTVWVQTGSLAREALVVGVALGLVACGILAVNNLRDREGDARAGKRTLAVRLGERFARAEHAVCLLAPFPLFGLLALQGGGTPWLVPCLALPLALREVAVARRADGRELNDRLGGAARVELALAVLLALGVAIA